MNIKKEREALVYLYCTPGFGKKTVERLIAVFGSAEEVLRAPTGTLAKATWREETEEDTASGAGDREAGKTRRILTGKQLESLEGMRKMYTAEGYAESLQSRGIGCVLRGDADFPVRLRALPDMPPALFYRGRLPENRVPAVAIIGARICSEYGRYMARQFGTALGASGLQVVSGMALGVDGISQKAALEAGGASYAVLGCGVDICYPPENRALFDRLTEQGGVISEFAPGTQPAPGHFPMRNRIISGLSDAVLVIEARRKSGTLITVDMALEQGREVYALPGRVTDRLSDGCNALIRQGAVMVTSPEDILEDFFGLERDREMRTKGGDLRQNRAADSRDTGKRKVPAERSALEERLIDGGDVSKGSEDKAGWMQMTERERAVMNLLDINPVPVSALHDALSSGGEPCSIPEILDTLVRLSIRGVVVQEGGSFRLCMT